MGTLKEDIKTQSDWIVQAFAADRLNLDYSVRSFIEIDKFFNKHSKNGKAISGGRIAQNFGPIIFSLGAYVGETIIKNVNGSYWVTDDNDPEGELTVSVHLPDSTVIWPIQKIAKRFQNGSEDSVYVYGYHVVKDYIDETFDSKYWELASTENKKPWWRFW